ncbi:unnamed protein product [Plasmodium vivax]|uniref:(malaria parasite P. vivax) hypothetical protein n=1 Tax=Plasmodium vivax TaxID=5855 RepID=A0A8S4H466_PLAVI|nr:unnamed protein product [Plasmodium vivax]
MSIPFKLIYNNERNGVAYALPSDKRNIDIIHGVKFGTILKHIYNKNKDDIDSWINEYEKNLTDYLNRKHNSWKNNDPGKYCTNLNYILDYIVQAIYNLEMDKSMHWAHLVDQISSRELQKYHSLNCSRDLYSYENKYLIFKKLMLDLCEDIEHIKKRTNFIKDKKCPLILSRLQYREKKLMELFHTFYHKSMFYQDKKCSIDYIHKNISNINCNKAKQQPKATVAPSSDSADTRVEGRINEPTDEEELETEALKAAGPDDGLDNSEQVHTFLDDLKFSLPVKEDAPKLDTTYAAASLAGISLFGTILYKYTPFGSLLNPRRGARIRGNVFPLGNNVYDASIMNNFEYLQTGIQDGQYQVGYGSITDY